MRAECIDAANVMRTARLDYRAPVLQRSAAMENAAKGLLDAAFQINYDCATLRPPNLEQVFNALHLH